MRHERGIGIGTGTGTGIGEVINTIGQNTCVAYMHTTCIANSCATHMLHMYMCSMCVAQLFSHVEGHPRPCF